MAVLRLLPGATIQENNIVNTITARSNFHTRYYTTQTGVDAANYIKNLWEGYAGGRSDISVDLYQHGWAQPSVIMTITGADFPDEIVVMGGHEDSISGFGVRMFSNPKARFCRTVMCG